jgi:hypothetical protein
MTTTPTTEPTTEFCELCDTTIQNGEPYYKDGPVAYHEKCAATYEDGSVDRGMSFIVANNRRLMRSKPAAS